MDGCLTHSIPHFCPLSFLICECVCMALDVGWCMRKHLLSECQTCIRIPLLIYEFIRICHCGIWWTLPVKLIRNISNSNKRRWRRHGNEITLDVLCSTSTCSQIEPICSNMNFYFLSKLICPIGWCGGWCVAVADIAAGNPIICYNCNFIVYACKMLVVLLTCIKNDVYALKTAMDWHILPSS